MIDLFQPIRTVSGMPIAVNRLRMAMPIGWIGMALITVLVILAIAALVKYLMK